MCLAKAKLNNIDETHKHNINSKNINRIYYKILFIYCATEGKQNNYKNSGQSLSLGGRDGR